MNYICKNPSCGEMATAESFEQIVSRGKLCKTCFTNNKQIGRVVLVNNKAETTRRDTHKQKNKPDFNWHYKCYNCEHIFSKKSKCYICQKCKSSEIKFIKKDTH